MRVALWLVVAALTLLGAGCADDTEPRAADRLVEVAGTHALQGEEAQVVVPVGRFAVTITESRAEVPADQAEDGEARRAPEGWRYVGIGWRPGGDIGIARRQALHSTDAKQVAVAVDDGQRSHPFFTTSMRPGEEYERRVWALVRADADSAVEVTYDGLTQRVDLATAEVETGRAAGLYDLRTLEVDCPASDHSDGGDLSYRIDCAIDGAHALPYVAGQGWAAEGRTWLVFELSVRPTTFLWTGSEGRRSLDVTGVTGEIGPDAVVLRESDASASGYGATVVVGGEESAPTPVRITRRYVLEPVDGVPTPEPTFEATVDFPAARG